jgi:hypothetical protein
MLFKSLPLSHRTAIFIAVFYPASQLIPWMYGAPLRPSHLLFMILFWGIVAFQWLQRRNPSWQFGSAGGFGQPNLIDTFGSWFDRQSASIKFAYWLAVIIAAIVIYRVM